MIQSFNYYLNENKVKREFPNLELAKALLRKAERRLNLLKSKKITNENADIIFEDIYETLRESAQALMAKQGFKPLSHEAVIAFLG